MMTYKKASYKIFALGPKFRWADPVQNRRNTGKCLPTTSLLYKYIYIYIYIAFVFLLVYTPLW